MSFARIWLTGLYNPAKAVTMLASQPAPSYGLYAVLLRSLLVSVCWYLPAAWQGRLPSPPSFITLLPTERYFAGLVWIFPLFALGTWLLGGALTHTLLRLGSWASDVDQILNIEGMGGLVAINFTIAIPLAALFMRG